MKSWTTGLTQKRPPPESSSTISQAGSSSTIVQPAAPPRRRPADPLGHTVPSGATSKSVTPSARTAHAPSPNARNVPACSSRAHTRPSGVTSTCVPREAGVASSVAYEPGSPRRKNSSGPKIHTLPSSPAARFERNADESTSSSSPTTGRVRSRCPSFTIRSTPGSTSSVTSLASRSSLSRAGGGVGFADGDGFAGDGPVTPAVGTGDGPCPPARNRAPVPSATMATAATRRVAENIVRDLPCRWASATADAVAWAPRVVPSGRARGWCRRRTAGDRRRRRWA